MGISAFMFLAIISYNPNDPVNINVADNPVQTRNWLGPLGAWFAHFMIQWTFGYAAIVFPALIFLIGLSLFRKISINEYSGIIYKMSAWAILISIFLAFPDAFRSNGHMILS